MWKGRREWGDGMLAKIQVWSYGFRSWTWSLSQRLLLKIGNDNSLLFTLLPTHKHVNIHNLNTLSKTKTLKESIRPPAKSPVFSTPALKHAIPEEVYVCTGQAN
ncbi:hypothetical protein AFLA_006651 [Aspergillus flavus NRRL3357]|nr:hypothetical protein AFLA_006651 [Aspergillus flavus NRRL3357]